MARLRRLEWGVRQKTSGLLGGEYRSAFRGRGIEFDQVVRYEFGDDVRDIDWNVTAKLGQPYRKQFIEEREVTVLLLVEDTPALLFGSGTRSKREAVLDMATLLSLLCAQNRDRLGIVVAHPTRSWVRPPVRGRGRIHHACAHLLGLPAPSMPSPPVELPWKTLFHAAPRHALLVWLGDFPPRPAPESWLAIARRYETVGIRVEDPWERSLPKNLRSHAFDPVTGGLAWIDGSSSVQQRAHAAWNAARDQAFEKLFPAQRQRLTMTPDEPTLDALIRLLRRRARP
jgi:uncharacterized protein (DUF58 family)